MISVIYSDEHERELAEFLTRTFEGINAERFKWVALTADYGGGEVLTTTTKAACRT